ncbi:2-polyprenyl-6-methoxyphenol hydroxylase-like FAD-dependent oxidoreductase [Asanoa ferruginea]|uniref:2-polyprenyl-6-methoxyphenol hydroxylase-like FAD-dependent oxidoreductase n=1 Tax=Asanoa ferruginea TaxID=53367 RepID=A0A3D9ZR29_9ACTN|nr:NAD(P)/FAD-dependent oxidoreductase [Asanoa ferruginea]REF99651.1 2-polyprenyl-6-methoxyphenol hydroxylase-like FAD-dependent oxidoreductase [Asanoa ferruginea]GIF52092.1 FAD-dependent oxidoreductase [Asanoa ferruginea]
MRVLIVGAGLGGLTLLHGLRAAGIDAHVYERSARQGGQPASYGIHLDANGLRALHNSLPADNWKHLDADGVPAPMVVRFHDPHRGVIATIDKRFPENATDPVTKRRAISRGELREALLRGTDSAPIVHWDKAFTHYGLTDDGVRAHFADGTHAEGDILVGADGSNSRVRHQRLPDLRRQELGIVNIAGRVPLAGDVAATLPAELTDGGINNVVPTRTGWMFLSTWATGDPYLVWAWAAAEDSYPPGVRDLDGTALKHLVTERTSTWSTPLRTLVHATDPGTITTVPLRTMPQLPDWTSSRITLLGDAIHNMTPMAGIGANTALRDADQLRRALSTSDNPVQAINAYETAMRDYANQALKLSTRNATNAALATRANRAAFRALLRAGTHLPALRRKMFGPTAR